MASIDTSPDALSIDTDEFRRLVEKGRAGLASLQRKASDPAAQDKGVKRLEPYYWVEIHENVPDDHLPPIARGAHPASRLAVANIGREAEEVSRCHNPQTLASAKNTSNAMAAYLYEYPRP